MIETASLQNGHTRELLVARAGWCKHSAGMLGPGLRRYTDYVVCGALVPEVWSVPHADAPLFGTPKPASRLSPLSAPQPAATIAGGAISAPAPAPGDSPTGGPDAADAPQQQQQQPQLQAAVVGGAAAAAAARGAAAQPVADVFAQQQRGSPFGGGAAAAPVFGIAAMRTGSLGTPKRGREEQAARCVAMSPCNASRLNLVGSTSTSLGVPQREHID